MKSLSITALCLLCLVPLSGFSATQPHAVIVVEDAQRDLGEVIQGTVLELMFAVENQGDDVLEISVRPTCGCTVVDFDSSIAAHQTGAIKALIDTKSFSGPISKSILVKTNDPARPTLNLLARAMVTQIIEVLPRPLVRVQAELGQATHSTVTIVPALSNSFEITSIEAGPDWLEADIRRLSAQERLPGKGETQYELDLRISELAPPGFVEAKVIVKTDHPDAPEIAVKVVGVITST